MLKNRDVLPLSFGNETSVARKRRWPESFNTPDALGEPTASQLGAFLQRSPNDRSLASMGYGVTGEGSQFQYSRTW